MFLRKPVAPYKAVNLSQSNDYLAYASNSGCDLEHTDTFTISFWYYLAGAVPANVPYQISKYSGGNLNNVGWGIFLDTNERANIRFCDGAGGVATFRSALVSPTGVWMHYVIQKTTTSVNGTYIFYHNGYRVQTTTIASTYNTAISCLNNSDLIIGDAPGTSSRNSTGRFKDFRIYKNKILSEEEIRRMYDLGRNQYKTYSYYLDNTPDVYLMREPGKYSIHPTTGNLMFMDELTKQFSLSGVNLTSTTQVVISNENPTPNFSSITSVIRCRENTFTNYSESLDVSYLYKKTAGAGSTYSRAASNQKVVGNFRVRFRNYVYGTSVRHLYIGLSKENTIPSNINSTSLLIGAGFNNGGYILYSAGTTVGSLGGAVNDRTATISVDYDRNLVETWYESNAGVIAPGFYFSCTTEHFGINKECYVIPYIFYNTNNREVYNLFWDFMNIPNPGYLAPNDLI